MTLLSNTIVVVAMVLVARTASAIECSCEENQRKLQDCTSTQDVVCINCTTCESGETFQTGTCGPMSIDDYVCTNCTVCLDHQFEAQPCSALSNTVCIDCRVCEKGTYRTGLCGPESDTDYECHTCAVCGPDQEILYPCNNTHDTVCQSRSDSNKTVGPESTTTQLSIQNSSQGFNATTITSPTSSTDQSSSQGFNATTTTSPTSSTDQSSSQGFNATTITSPTSSTDQSSSQGFNATTTTSPTSSTDQSSSQGFNATTTTSPTSSTDQNSSQGFNATTFTSPTSSTDWHESNSNITLRITSAFIASNLTNYSESSPPLPVFEPSDTSKAFSGFLSLNISTSEGWYVNITKDSSEPTCTAHEASGYPRTRLIMLSQTTTVSAVACAGFGHNLQSTILRQRYLVNQAPSVIVSFAFSGNFPASSFSEAMKTKLLLALAEILHLEPARLEFFAIRNNRQRRLLDEFSVDILILASSPLDATHLLQQISSMDISPISEVLPLSITGVSSQVVTPQALNPLLGATTEMSSTTLQLPSTTPMAAGNPGYSSALQSTAPQQATGVSNAEFTALISAFVGLGGAVFLGVIGMLVVRSRQNRLNAGSNKASKIDADLVYHVPMGGESKHLKAGNIENCSDGMTTRTTSAGSSNTSTSDEKHLPMLSGLNLGSNKPEISATVVGKGGLLNFPWPMMTPEKLEAALSLRQHHVADLCFIDSGGRRGSYSPESPLSPAGVWAPRHLPPDVPEPPKPQPEDARLIAWA